MLSKVLGFFAKRGKQLAGSDKAGNAYYRQVQDVEGKGRTASSSSFFIIVSPAHSFLCSPASPLTNRFLWHCAVSERRWVEFGGSSVVEPIPGEFLVFLWIPF